MKSAYELAMEKLRKQDAERGEKEPRLSDRQREEIAEIRSFYKSKLAEREILHKSELAKAAQTEEPEAVRTVEEGYQRDRAHLESEMESKVRAVRERSVKKG